MPYEEVLSMLFQDELDSRNQTSLQRRISQAKFEEVKTFEGFDLKRYSLKIRHAINDKNTNISILNFYLTEYSATCHVSF